MLADAPPPLPEVAEPDVVRHFTNLSTLNMSVDTHYYPLGSCTMKYNPKRNERLAALPGHVARASASAGRDDSGTAAAACMNCSNMLAEIAGLPAVSLQPAAGAHGELTALMVAAAHFRERDEPRQKVLTPDSAHGTNPASARDGRVSRVKTSTARADGYVDMEDLRRQARRPASAVFMITNPNTLGLFDRKVREIADRSARRGRLIYLDGANMNAILGVDPPGRFRRRHDALQSAQDVQRAARRRRTGRRADLCHRVPRSRTCPGRRRSGPDGGVEFRLDGDRPDSIGRVRSFFGNVGVLVRAYAYIRTHGSEGLRAVSENAVLNANYLLSRVKHILPVPHGDRCMHEFVASASHSN